MNGWEIAGVLTGIVAVWLTTRENVWCWPCGLVNVLLFAVVFFDAKLYAGMGLQVVYAALALYGWWAWRHGGSGGGELTVSRTPRAVLFALGAVGVLSTFGLGAALARATDAALPYWDAGTASFSLVAQALQTRKWIENWLLWIAVDVVYVAMYVNKELYPTAVLYTVFLGLAVAGLFSWRRSMRAREATTR